MEKEILTQINRTVLAVLLRALRVLYREDSRIRTEIDSWPEGLTLKLKCGPGGAVLALQKSGTYGIRRLRAAQHTDIGTGRISGAQRTGRDFRGVCQTSIFPGGRYLPDDELCAVCGVCGSISVPTDYDKTYSA